MKISKKNENILITLLITLFFLFALIPSKSYPYELTKPLIFTSLYVAILSILALVMLIIKKSVLFLPGLNPYGLFISAILLMIGTSIIRSGLNLWTVCFISILITSLLVFNLVKYEIIDIRQIGLAISLVFFLELLAIFGQAVGIMPSKSSYFLVTGTFSNPNIIATFLVSCYPLVIYTLGNSSKGRNLAIVALFLTIGALYLLGSRTAMLGLIGVITYSIIVKFWQSRKEKLQLSPLILFRAVAAIGLLIISFISLNSLKTKSSESRQLIWLNSLDIIAEQPVWGYGIGSYQRKISQSLSQYFIEHEDATERDNFKIPIVTAYNDYIQLSTEGGIIGLGVIISLGGILLWQSKVNDGSIISLKACILAVLILSLTNTVIYTLIGGFIAAIVYPVAYDMSDGLCSVKINNKVVKIGLVGLFSFSCYYLLKLDASLRALQSADALIENKAYNKALSSLMPLKHILHNNGKYWNYIGDAFYKKGRLVDARKAYENAIKLNYDPTAFSKIAGIDRKQNNLDSAIYYNKIAESITPGRLAYSFDLFNLYRAIQDSTQAIKYALRVSHHNQGDQKTASHYKFFTDNYLSSLNKK